MDQHGTDPTDGPRRDLADDRSPAESAGGMPAEAAPPQAAAGSTSEPGPASGAEREPVLDALRGFALLGILLINIELMRGADFLRVLGELPLETAPADEVTQFLTGWLAAGKFISSFAIMFGIGAVLIAVRRWRAGRSPVGVLARRYGLLIPLGLAHMLLLFPGDVLFAYGLGGMVLLLFVGIGVRARTALWWSGGILAVLLVLGVGLSALIAAVPDPPADDPAVAEMEGFFAERAEAAVVAHQEGGYGDVVAGHAWEALFIQLGTLVLLPWIVALFLFGYAVGVSGLVGDLAGRRHWLRRGAAVGLIGGLVVNLPNGFLGPLSTGAGLQPGAGEGPLLVAATAAQIAGAPLLAVGYLSAVALLCLRLGVPAPLAAVGRMALTAYLAQSALTLAVFAGLGWYDRLGSAASMGVVVGVWTVLLVACPLWLRWFRFGPVEWLWRTLTYGRRQPLRAG